MTHAAAITAVILNGQPVRVLTPGPRCVATDLALALRGTPEVEALLMDVPETFIELQSVEVFPLGPMLVRTLGLSALEWLVSSAGPHHRLGWLPGWLEAAAGSAADKALTNAPGTDLTLNLGELNIHQDEAGRFSLNDLHRAAVEGGEDYKRCQTEHFLRNEQTQALIEALRGEIPENGELKVDPVAVAVGRYGGTYVCRELVYAYAMWISAKFYLQVIRAYDALVTGRAAAPVPALPPAQGGCDLFALLMAVCNGRRVAAVLLLYLLANDAHRRLLLKSVGKIHREINGLFGRRSLQRAANALVSDGLLYLIDGGYGVNEPSLLQRISVIYRREVGTEAFSTARDVFDARDFERPEDRSRLLKQEEGWDD